MVKKIWLSWSSGKDSAWALHYLRQDQRYRVVGLLTTVNQAFDRVAMHAVPTSLLKAQARATGLSVRIVPLPWPCSNDRYESILGQVWKEAEAEGVEGIAFGDLFLEEVRRYRIEQLKVTRLEPLFPLWELSTRRLAEKMILSGLRARLTCIDPRQLDSSFAGRDFDTALLNDLPSGVDPCGENGEFHSFVYDGPMFETALKVTVGEVIERDGFIFADLKEQTG